MAGKEHLEQNILFNKGLQTDSSVINQPEGTYIDALNITLLNDDGEYFSICNEKGTVTPLNLHTNYVVIGHCVVDVYCLLFMVNPTNGFSQIGVVNTLTNTYTKKAPLVGENNDLNFDINHPINAIGRKIFNGNIITYFTDNYNSIGVLNIDNLPNNLTKSKSILPILDLPVIEYDSIINGGNLKAGSYQFCIRYLNKQLVPTVATLPTNPIAIIGSLQSDVTDITKTYGAEYDTFQNKSIKLNISNLDVDYPYFELIVITYEGATSAPNAYILDTFDITDSIKTVVVSDIDEDARLSTVDEVLTHPITYDKAKTVEQKNNRLLFSNLTESRSRYINELQTVANNVRVTYSTEIQDINYYANPLNSVNNKTYKRGEIYSLSFAVRFLDGTISYAYHIPAPYVAGTAGTVTNQANTTTKVLGTYLSTDLYPTNQGYPVNQGDGNTNIRHHVMPTIEQENHVISETEISLLKLNFEFLTAIPQSIKDEIQEIIFLREPRNSPFKKRKISQGFITNLYLGAKEYETGDELTGANDNNQLRPGDVSGTSLHIRRKFGFMNINLNSWYSIEAFPTIRDRTDYNLLKYSTHQGFYYSNITLDKKIIDERISSLSTGIDNALDNIALAKYQDLTSLMNADKVVFFSPEVNLADGAFLNPDRLKGVKLKSIRLFNTTDETFKEVTLLGQHNQKRYLSKVGNYCIRFKVTTEGTALSGSYQIKEAEFINNGVSKKIAGLGNIEFSNEFGNKVLYLYLFDTITQNSNSRGNVLTTDTALNNGGRAVDELLYEIKNMHTTPVSNAGFNNYIELYELENDISNQYGNIENSNYSVITTSKNIATDSYSNIFGGDIYITQFTAINRNLFSRYFPFTRLASNNPRYFQESHKNASTDETRIVTQTTVGENTYSPSQFPGTTLVSAVTYPVESEINCYWRYRGENGVPYHPIEPFRKVSNVTPNQDENKNYNVQYSIDNSINTYLVTRPVFDEPITNYPNRTIYSEPSLEDDKVDNYQIFKQNSFYDLPEDTGEIWDSFVWNNELYLHTPKALWRTFFNTPSKEVTDIGEVVLGSGGLFNIESQKVISTNGGYGGTISQFGNVVTPFGRFFVDLLQRKVFNFTNNLEEISLIGMQQFFDENLFVNNLNGTFIDNPYNNSQGGITMGWDNEYKRVLLTQNVSNHEFTICYYPSFKCWGSFHSFIPNDYIAVDKWLFSIKSTNNQSTFNLHNVGNYGEFYNQVYESSVTTVTNKFPSHEKTFDNFEVHSRSYESVNNGFNNFDFFNTLECYNDYQNSGIVNINTTNDFNPVLTNDEILSRWKKSHFQVYIPRDNQEANLTSNDGWQQASRLKSKYLITKWRYLNLDNRKFIVNFIRCLFRIVAR